MATSEVRGEAPGSHRQYQTHTTDGGTITSPPHWQTRFGLAAFFVITVVLSACAPLPTRDSTVGECLAANGLAYGPFRDGQDPYHSPPVIPRIDQIEEDLRFLSRITNRIRTYKTTDTQSNIPHFAKRFGMSVAQGIELTADDAVNQKQIGVAVQMAREGLVESLIVGNEALSSGTLSKSRLLAYLKRVRQVTPKEVLVTTAEVWDVWNKNPDLVGAVDFVMAHFYPFWEKQHIDDANQSLWRNYETLQRTLRRTYPSREPRIVIGETGWPSGGPAHGRAVPNAHNQRRFLEEFTASACARAVPFYFFEAFDEEWKWKEGVTRSAAIPPRNRSLTGKWIGASWGLYRSNGKLKTALAGLLEQPAPGSRLNKEILSEGRLAAQYRLVSASVEGKAPRVSRANDAVEITYAAGQRSGVVYVAVGESNNALPAWRDYSEFDAVSFELRGSHGRENVSVSIKNAGNSQDGNVAQIWLNDVATKFQTYTIPLSQFASEQLAMPDGLTRLHVVLQFGFSGSQPQTVYVKNIRYLALR